MLGEGWHRPCGRLAALRRARTNTIPNITMARMLADRDSSALHINQARRHERLARRYRQEAIADAIRGPIAALKAKSDATDERDLERQGAYDDTLAADADLDDGIRNLYNSAEIFDRGNPGAITLATLFPDGRFTDITQLPLAQEPAAAEALATKVDSLGADHALAPHAGKIRVVAEAVRTALAALGDAIRALKMAEAEEEIAKNAVSRQYEGNYLDARKTLGRALAERIFPVSRSSSAAPTEAPAEPVPG